MSNQETAHAIRTSIEQNVPVMIIRSTKEEVAAEAFARLQDLKETDRVILWSNGIHPTKEDIGKRNCIQFREQPDIEGASAAKIKDWTHQCVGIRPDVVVAVNPDLFMLTVLCKAGADYGVPVVFFLTDTSVFDQALAVEGWEDFHTSLLYMKLLFDLVPEEDRYK